MKRAMTTRVKIGIGVAVFAATIAVRSTASAQREGNSVAGRVVDAGTHNVLDAVRVTVKGTDLRGRTDSDGSFHIDKVRDEKVVLVMSRSGYKSREVEVLVTGAPAQWTVALWKFKR